MHLRRGRGSYRGEGSEGDQIVPSAAAGPFSAKLPKDGTLKTHEDVPRGMPTTHSDRINPDLAVFLKS
jgi:non-heme chloroperoxidase